MTATVSFPTPEALMEKVSASAGLTDFGDDSYREGLTRLLDSVEREAGLGEAAAQQLIGVVERRLLNRLQVEQWYGDHPELEQLEVGPVTSIAGLPRTGTTALVNILSLDEQFRPLRNWEQNNPCPPPILAEEKQDPRRLAALEAAEKMLRDNPEFAAMHLLDVDATEEDVELLGMAFAAQQMVLPIFSYHAWWRDTDMRPAFAYHRRVVKLLQSRRPPNRWLFKAPAHSFHLESLLSAYPDARVIITHRDPAKVIPSTISLLASLLPAGLQLPLEEFGRLHTEHFRIGAERAIEARARIGEDRFLDVQHSDFIRDPMATVARVYRFLDLEWRPDTRARMEAWHEKNQSGAHGVHSYTPEQFGLSAEQIRSDFDFYIKRFDVPVGR